MTGGPTSAMLGLSTGPPPLHSGNLSVRQVHCIVLRPGPLSCFLVPKPRQLQAGLGEDATKPSLEGESRPAAGVFFGPCAFAMPAP